MKSPLHADRARALRVGADADPEVLARALGVCPTAVPEAVHAAEIDPETVAAFELLPLVEAAWADGSVEPDKRWRVLSHGLTLGLELGEPAHARVERWLRTAPEPALFDAWYEVAAARRQPTAPSPERLLAGASDVASATGEKLGLRPVSNAGSAVLRRLSETLQRAAA